MKQSEKSAKSRARILAAAMERFAGHGYEGVTLNEICEKNNISKGQFYHYFDSKEELYRACSTQSFGGLTECLRANAAVHENYADSIESYVDARTKFFQTNGACGRFVLSALLSVSKEGTRLASSGIETLKLFNLAFFGAVLDGCVLREGISREKAMDYLEMTQQMYHSYLNARLFDAGSGDAIGKYQEQVKELLGIVMRGIVQDGSTR